MRAVLNKVETRIDASECAIREIPGVLITYGLFYNNELVQTMSFGKVNDDWELTQNTTKNSILVTGGMSKLFNYFIQQHRPNKITAYCDFNKFAGHEYEVLGMRLVGYTEPNVWYMLPNKDIVSEYAEEAVSKIYGAGNKIYVWEKV